MSLEDLRRAAGSAIHSLSGETEAAASHEKHIRVVFEGNEFSQAAAGSESALGIRSVEGGRQGFASTNQLDQAHTTAREANELALLSQPSPFNRILAGNKAEHIELVDPALADISPADAVELLAEFVRAAQIDRRVTIDRAEISFAKTTRYILNSCGIEKSSAITRAQFSIMGMARAGDEVTSFDYDGSTVRRLEDVLPAARKAGGDFARSVLGCLGASAIRSYQGPVLFHPRAVSDLLGSAILFNTNARQHQDQASSFRHKMGQVVAHPGMEITENPLDQERPEEWAAFDREGIDCENRSIVHEGRLVFVAHNGFTASRGSASPTGNASGSVQGMPAIGLRNLRFEMKAGTLLEDSEMLRMAEGLLVVVRFSGNDDPVSGQFSGLARNSWFVENGSIKPVSEVMIAGNVFDMMQRIAAAGRKTHSVFGGAEAPYLLVDGINVTAGSHGS
jgi:PmbA protein